MPRAYFTDLALRKLKAPTSGHVYYWDQSLPAFGCRVSARGTKTFTVIYGARRLRKTIGRFPAISLADARREAHTIIGTYQTHTPSLSFDTALEQFFAIHTSTLKPRSKREIERILRHHFQFGKKRLDEITKQDISRVLDSLRETPSEARHALKDFRTFSRWCVMRGYIQRSPCDGMAMPAKYVPRQRVLTDTELRSLWVAANDEGYPFGTFLKMLILTGQRRSEINSLRFEYLNSMDRTITFPETKNGRVHTIPYGRTFAAALKEVPHQEGFLFPGRDPEKPYDGGGKQKWLLDKKVPIEPWTMHDLRRTFATNLAALRTAPHVVERLLNHSAGKISGVAAIYNRFEYLDEMRDAIETWDKKLASLLRHRLKSSSVRRSV